MSSDRHSPNVFSHTLLDRHGSRRRDAAWLEALDADTVRLLPMVDGMVPVTGDPAAPRLAFAAMPDVPDGPRIFLGMLGGFAYFAALVPKGGRESHLGDLRSLASLLPAEEASLAAYALGLVRWHERSGFCGVCGAATLVTEAGHKRLCSNQACNAEHFPRTDPAVIVLIEHGDACLLGRNARHRPGMHSTLAGFVEPGESLEAAVIREVFEEAAVTLESVSYQSSQPWPFPASLMIGFHAVAASRDFQVDGQEIVEAAWFTRDRLAPYIEGKVADETFSLPGKLSISRRLIEDWYRSKG